MYGGLAIYLIPFVQNTHAVCLFPASKPYLIQIINTKSKLYVLFKDSYPNNFEMCMFCKILINTRKTLLDYGNL